MRSSEEKTESNLSTMDQLGDGSKQVAYSVDEALAIAEKLDIRVLRPFIRWAAQAAVGI